MEPFNCTLFNGDQTQCATIVIVKRVLASISIVGSFAMIFIIWLFKKYQFFSQRLIMYLSIAALFDSIAYVMGGILPDGSLCTFEAVLLSIFDWSVLLWITIITFNLYWNAVAKKNTERFEIYYHFIAWGLPIVISMLPFIRNMYGPAGAWCWIKDDTAWRFAIWYGPLFLIIFALFCVYLYIFIYIRRQANRWTGSYDPEMDRNRELMRKEIRPLMAYPFVYLLLNICPLVNRIQNAVNPKHAIFTLLLLQVVSSSLQGAINAIIFGMDRETLNRLNVADLRNAWSQRCSKSVVREYPVVNESSRLEDDYQSDDNPVA